MARIRTIKPEFFTSEDIVELEPLARLLYIAIWCEADKEGRLAWKPKTFKMRYLPADDCNINALCDALVTRGLVSLYGDGLAVIPSFTSHQHINPRESESKLPAPNDASTTREPRDSDGANQDCHDVNTRREERKGKEGKGKEGNDVRVNANIGISFPEFLKDCEEKNVLPIPEGDAVFKWAEAVRIPEDFVLVGWQVFKSRDWVDVKGKSKKYKDWRAVFLNYCKNPDWLDVWSISRDGEYFLTPKGKQAHREFCGVTA